MPIPFRGNPMGTLANGEYEFGDHLYLNVESGAISTDLPLDFTANSARVTIKNAGYYSDAFASPNHRDFYSRTGDPGWGPWRVYGHYIPMGISVGLNVQTNVCDWFYTPNGWNILLSTSTSTALRAYSSSPQELTLKMVLCGSTTVSSELYRCRYWTSADMTTLPYADLRPCKRKSDDWPGMYDVVRHKFFPANSKTAFTLVP